MVPNRILMKEKVWCLAGLENVFNYALEQKSKCLIQACILIAEQEFCGVSSFDDQTQVKFLLESIRHIIIDNCQEEFIHILHYLNLLHSLCSDVGSPEEYVNSMLKIKQSFVLYTLLDNESAADVCLAMNDFFPKDDALKMFSINKSSMRRRFLAAVRREIYSFQKLVNKLLTDIEFRQYYFFDEWMEEFGPTFHKEMISDIDCYLRRIEEQLLRGSDRNKNYRGWLLRKSVRNPAMLCFLKLLMEAKTDKIPEFEVLALLKWMFPSLDTMLLTMPCEGSLEVPEVLKETTFDKLLSKASKSICIVKPWDCDSFHQALVNLAETSNNSPLNASLSPKSFYGSNKVNSSNGLACTSPKTPIEIGKPERTALATLNGNRLSMRSFGSRNLRKRKCADPEGIVNQAAKKPCISKATFSKVAPAEHLFVDLHKENVLALTPNCSVQCTESNSAIKLSFRSPYCKKLLESGSKFFSTGGKRKKRPPPRTARGLHASILGESSLEAIQFSDEDNHNSGSSCLNIAEETMANALTWISTSRNSEATTSRRNRYPATCRSLHFKSEPSDDHVSESEHEQPTLLQPVVRLQDCLKTLDLSLVPDLLYHLKTPDTNPCTVQMQCLSDLIIDRNLIKGCKVRDQDLDTISRHQPRFKFCNYSAS